MFKVLFIVFAFGAPEQEYDAVQRYNDSLLIYNTYQSQAQMLKSMKETDRQAWYKREAYADSLTACAKMRLKRYNHESYKPNDVFESQGFGISYLYPRPSTIDYETAPAFAKASAPNYRFIVYDKQTHFQITENLGKVIPYIKKLIFDKGRLLYIEKLNPVTFEKL